MLRIGQKGHRYYVALGYYKSPDQYYGHSYALFNHSYHKKWFVMETTWDQEVNPFLWVNWDKDQYIPAILFNRYAILRMDNKHHRALIGLNEEWYKRHYSAIRDMINYVTVGKQLKVSYMHKTVNPVPIERLSFTITKLPLLQLV